MQAPLGEVPGAKDTGAPELLVAASVSLPPTVGLLGGVKLIFCSPLPTLMGWVTGLASL